MTNANLNVLYIITLCFRYSNNINFMSSFEICISLRYIKNPNVESKQKKRRVKTII